MALYGMSRTFYVGNLMPMSMEVSSPSMAVVTYMTEMVFEGVGGLTIPYLAGKSRPRNKNEASMDRV